MPNFNFAKLLLLIRTIHEHHLLYYYKISRFLSSKTARWKCFKAWKDGFYWKYQQKQVLFDSDRCSLFISNSRRDFKKLYYSCRHSIKKEKHHRNVSRREKSVGGPQMSLSPPGCPHWAICPNDFFLDPIPGARSMLLFFNFLFFCARFLLCRIRPAFFRDIQCHYLFLMNGEFSLALFVRNGKIAWFCSVR